ncbi:hypothetical protein A2331_00495 [Candidatus Falkowbacteria bacterium RIFOXYB2_FULL_34_18]|uniref:Uncharacterized protein n=1 Tax=Candidatus Falkowbacteria bacterium RIFOXYD2_FULL_34_120 TaxID=1798007 RepID=A0A1F5TQD9_9BACT|nr:MAG: hypothetical protein A2331_00495 [Candidatus Falkowbacteria bacterium RIFOXYB2_FULL_34_18]OGF29033.1 MAG: hypothetical protein A2500_01895 [Candidatus Falkowbacteria bacterium RIFOXYC12_FULL_34_55]OGF36066.1 MAG: hypothetical protein A2466_00195 [Candidatus Falkowbacteria bacterium RIFOXYC2_FULL_34_220]OGF38544.1 MAG: hypothetical protein A2515_05155 [Candidatus Falkowbacteria bacterium RIFOXYD12_FULL_34_57]OGF40711.1 MAG: hypothetical protein A2531_05715 [Candidatus Falkowbacteria bact
MTHQYCTHKILISEKEHKIMLDGVTETEIELIGPDMQKDIQKNDLVIMKVNKDDNAWMGKVLFRAVNKIKIFVHNNYKSQTVR